jgi:hypothetical protein
MRIILELQNYIKELHSISDECQRPTDTGGKCVQCREKEEVAYRLERIIADYQRAQRSSHQWAI